MDRKVIRVKSFTFYDPFIQKIQIFLSFYEDPKLLIMVIIAEEVYFLK